MKKKPSIFISYSWKTKEIAENISSDLQIIGIPIIKDNQELSFTDNIPSFMKRIRQCDFALLLISDSYLKSKNCLFEILELQKDENHWDKVLPIVFEDAKFNSPLERLEYVKYWEEKTNELEKVLKNINPINSPESFKELKFFKDITANIDEFLIKVSQSLNFSPEELIKRNYKPIIEKIGVDYEPKALIDLLRIVLISNLEQREIELDKYLEEYKESSYFYSIKGGTSRDLGKFDQAIHYYKKGLKLNPKNYEILNNLGQIVEYVKKDYNRARDCYKKAINANPNFDIPRLNLGVLLKQHFNDDKGSKEQYFEILKFDPNNAKAHNNLSNFYKMPNATKDDLVKAEYHMKKAIETDPNYIDALINYGNFLKVYKKQYEEGNKYYKRVLKLDKKGKYKEMIEVLLKSKKG